MAERAARVLLESDRDLFDVARRGEILFFPLDCVYAAKDVDEVFANETALRTALRSRSHVALRSALTLLATVDPEAAGPLAHDMIRDIQVALSDAGEQLADAERLLVLARLGQDEEP